MTLLQAHETRLKIKQLTDTLPTLGLIERCEVQDEILELKEQLGEFQRVVADSGSECESCSG